MSTQSMAWPHRTNRLSDTSPFFGGDGIQTHGDSPQIECTSAFDVTGRNDRKSYMLTAGHCFNRGTLVDTNLTHPRTMGRVVSQAFAPFGLDVETISGQYAPIVWTSGQRTVTGSGDVRPRQGSSSLVAVNGAVTGEHRKLPVVAQNQCVAFANDVDVTCSLDVVTGFEVQDGDSGGPVYQYSASAAPEASAAGTIRGINRDRRNWARASPTDLCSADHCGGEPLTWGRRAVS